MLTEQRTDGLARFVQLMLDTKKRRDELARENGNGNGNRPAADDNAGPAARHL